VSHHEGADGLVPVISRRATGENPNMKCADIMSKNLEWLTEKDSVQRAALAMADAGIGFLPICDARKQVIGVVTARDLTTRALAKTIAAETISAASIMTAPAITCLETANVHDAEELMAEERIRRLVIVDNDGKLTGVLGLADVVEHAPGRETLQTVKAVLARGALGPRGGATRSQPLLQGDPNVRNLPAPSVHLKVFPTVFEGGHRGSDTKEFPG
jgi:CBS domain-containing protein